MFLYAWMTYVNFLYFVQSEYIKISFKYFPPLVAMYQKTLCVCVEKPLVAYIQFSIRFVLCQIWAACMLTLYSYFFVIQKITGFIPKFFETKKKNVLISYNMKTKVKHIRNRSIVYWIFNSTSQKLKDIVFQKKSLKINVKHN